MAMESIEKAILFVLYSFKLASLITFDSFH